MGAISAVTANPSTVAPGGTSKIVPTVTGTPATDKTVSVTVSLDGSTGSAQIDLHSDAEKLTYSVNSADKGKPGFVVAQTDVGTLSVGSDGASFVLQL
jgi:hypothetical protein